MKSCAHFTSGMHCTSHVDRPLINSIVGLVICFISYWRLSNIKKSPWRYGHCQSVTMVWSMCQFHVTHILILYWRHIGVMASQIRCLSIVCSTACSAWQPRRYQSSASLAVCDENPLVTGGFRSQSGLSNSESVPMSWRHNEIEAWFRFAWFWFCYIGSS